MTHRTTARFWHAYDALPPEVRRLADESYALPQTEPEAPVTASEKSGSLLVRAVGIHHRSPAVQEEGDYVWFWIGRHDEYDRLIGAR